jgi:tetratricopeptide (TPR) repeat protein
MKYSHRFLLALAGTVAVATPALAQHGRNRSNTTCPTPVIQTHNSHSNRFHNNRSHGNRSNSNFGFSISLGNSGRYHNHNSGHWGNTWGNRSSHWGSHHAGHFSHTRFGHSGWGSRSYRSAYRQPVVVYQQPVVRQPVIVERPVVIDRPVYAQPVREVYREVPIYRDTAVESVYQDPRTRYDAGWNAVKAGDYGYAREFFNDQAVRRPEDPAPKAGLAIARAASGHDDQAEWAMRRAVRAGFARARDGLPHAQLESTLASIEKRYDERSYTYNDRWFMLSATRYLLGDFAGAKDAANRALSFDERDADARRLYDLVAHTG